MLYSRSFIIMAFSNLFTVSSFGCFFLFPLFITSRGGSKADIGIIMGASAMASVLCRPSISAMVDRIGRRSSYAIGCIMMSFLPLIYLCFEGRIPEIYLPLLTIRFLHGIGLAICFTSAFTFIADIIPPSRLNEGIGMFGITGLVGMALGPATAEVIIRELGFPIFFATASGIAIVGFLLQLLLPESYVKSSQEPDRSFFNVLKMPRILTVALLALLFGFGLAASGSFVAPFAADKHLPFVTFYFLAYTTSAVITRLSGGKLADRVGERRIVPYGFIIGSVGLASLSFLGGIPLLILSGLLSGCGHGLLFPSLNSLAIRDEPSHIRGRITGIYTGGIDAGVFTGSVLLGFIGEWAGFRVLFLAAALSLLLGYGIFHIYQRKNA
jgi:MFS family permease